MLVSKPRRAPDRGRVVVIRTPTGNRPCWRVKRVVGLPGDILVFEDGLLFINGIRHAEPYLRGLPAYLGLDRMSFQVGDGRYFVLGDNRTYSDDSRAFGPVDASLITGVVAARLWPWPPTRLS